MSRMLKALQQIDRRRSDPAVEAQLNELEAHCDAAVEEFSQHGSPAELPPGPASPHDLTWAEYGAEGDSATAVQGASPAPLEDAAGDWLDAPPSDELGDSLAEAEVAEVSAAPTATQDVEDLVEPADERLDPELDAPSEPIIAELVAREQAQLVEDVLPTTEAICLKFEPRSVVVAKTVEEPCDDDSDTSTTEITAEGAAEPADACRLPTDPGRVLAYRSLADRIARLPSTRGPCVVLLVTVGELVRAHLSVADLAAALSQRTTGETVVVDAHLDRPLLSLQTDTQDDPGWTDAIDGPLDRCSPRATTLERVEFLPCGQNPRAVSHTSAEPAELWRNLAAGCRFVLVEAGAAQSAVSQSLAHGCDAVFLVLGFKETTRQTAVEALETLEASGVTVSGCIALECR